MTLEDILKKRFSRYSRFDVMRWLIDGHRSVGHAEKMSLISLIAYRAVETDTPSEDLQQRFMEHFNITRMEQLSSDDYADAVKFLMGFEEAAPLQQGTTDKVA